LPELEHHPIVSIPKHQDIKTYPLLSTPGLSTLPTLSRLATIRLLLGVLVPAQPSCQRQINPRRLREAKALGDLGEVELVDVEDGAQAVAGVGVEVGPVALLGALVEVVVLADQLLELRLDVEDLLGWEVELDDGDSGRLEVGKEADFVGLEEHERAALGVAASGCSADAVDVVARVIGRVELDNPVD
jgi:hypothetical protein